MLSLDSAATQFINALAGQSHLFDQVMLAITNYGVPFLIVSVALQWWVRRDRPGSRHAFVAAGLAFLIGLGLNQIILLFFSRLRPYDVG